MKLTGDRFYLFFTRGELLWLTAIKCIYCFKCTVRKNTRKVFDPYQVEIIVQFANEEDLTAQLFQGSAS